MAIDYFKLEDFPLFTPEVGIELLGNNASIFYEIIRDFSSGVTDYKDIEEMRVASSLGDWRKVRFLADRP